MSNQSPAVVTDKFKLHRKQLIHGYEQEFEVDGKSMFGFVYWQDEQRVLGLLIYADTLRLFEKQPDRTERKDFMHNAPDTMLEAKWKLAFKNKRIKISKFDDQSAELAHMSQTLTLPSITDKKVVSQRQRELFTTYMREIAELSSIVDESKEKDDPKKANTHKPLPNQNPTLSRRPRPFSTAGPSTKVPKQELDTQD